VARILVPNANWKRFFIQIYFRPFPRSNHPHPHISEEFIPQLRLGLVHLKCVLVGSPKVGKTCLGYSFSTDGIFLEEVDPVVLYESKLLQFGNLNVNVGLWDTCGYADYARLRPLSYPPTDVFALIFSLVDPTSLWDILDIWQPEIAHHIPGAPFVLIGTKMDLRHTVSRSVTTRQGVAMAAKLGAKSYIECSSRTNENVREAFRQVVCTVFAPPRTKQKRCNVQ